MEVLSLHSELRTETGEALRVCYRLLEDTMAGETTYGLLSFVEGSETRPDQQCWLPELFESRWMGQAVLEFIASHGVMPVHIETILQEALP